MKNRKKNERGIERMNYTCSIKRTWTRSEERFRRRAGVGVDDMRAKRSCLFVGWGGGGIAAAAE